MNVDSDQNSSNSEIICNIISFPTDTHLDVSKEEIGKWVDQLMEMPDPDPSFTNRFDDTPKDFKDPLIQVAERILSEERI